MVLTVISILVGAALAWRFTVLILIPTIALDLVFVAAAGVAQGDDIWSIALAMVLSGTGLQIGYLGGTAVLSPLFATAATHTTPKLNTARLAPPVSG